MRIVEILTEVSINNSSWITSLLYNRKNKIITMGLNTGRQYSIKGPSRQTFERWKSVESKGQYWHKHIKDIFPISRIK